MQDLSIVSVYNEEVWITDSEEDEPSEITANTEDEFDTDSEEEHI